MPGTRGSLAETESDSIMKTATIGIIGGKGKMGRWFERFFSESGHVVQIADVNTVTTARDLAQSCNVVLLCTPVAAALEIAGQVGPLMQKNQLLADLCSQKSAIVKRMVESTSAQVLGIHPMFGQHTSGMAGQNIILCPGQGEYWPVWLERQFTDGGAVVTRMSPEKHDRLMAVIQSLTHLLTIVFGRTLQKMNLPPHSTLPYATPIYRINVDLIGRLFALDLDLYASLVGENPYLDETIAAFGEALKEGQNCLVDGSEEEKRNYLQSIREFLGDFCEEGLEESNRIIRAMYTTDSK